MYWNYRMVRTDYEQSSSYDIHEVYYDDNDQIEGWSADPLSPSGKTIAWLKKDLAYMAQALDRPLLTKVVAEDGKEKLVGVELDQTPLPAPNS